MYLIEVMCEGVDHVQLFLDRMKFVAILQTGMTFELYIKREFC